MGDGPTKKEEKSSLTRTEPWAPAVPALKRVLDGVNGQFDNAGATATETGALDALSANAAAGNPFAPAIGALATDLLTGGTNRSGAVTQAYDALRGGLMPYTAMSTDPYGNPAFTKAVGSMSDDILDRVKSSYAGAGYSPAGAGDFAKSVGEGISRGVAPAWLQAYNDLEARKLGAINGLYGAGNTTAGLLAGMDQTALGNRQAGIGAAQSALMARDLAPMRQLEIEAQRRGIPLKNLAQLENLIVPMAQLGGVTAGKETKTSETHVPIAQQILGAGLAGAGLLSGMGGPAALGGLGGAAGLLGGLFGGAQTAGFAGGGPALVPTFQPSGQFSYVPRYG